MTIKDRIKLTKNNRIKFRTGSKRFKVLMNLLMSNNPLSKDRYIASNSLTVIKTNTDTTMIIRVNSIIFLFNLDSLTRG